MRVYTVHARPGVATASRGDGTARPAGSVPEAGRTPLGTRLTPPVLEREGFSWGALILAPLWFAARRMWIVLVIWLAAAVAAAALLPEDLVAVAALGLAWIAGVAGRDLHRWTLERRGYAMVGVVLAPDEDAALARLVTRRPEFARAAAA